MKPVDLHINETLCLTSRRTGLHPDMNKLFGKEQLMQCKQIFPLFKNARYYIQKKVSSMIDMYA